MRILIAEEGQHVISAVRILRKMGHSIFLSTSRDDMISKMMRSRTVEHTTIINDPRGDRDWITSLKGIYDRNKIDVFYPFGYDLVTAYMDSIHENDELRMNTPYSGYDAYWSLSDKHRLYDLCSDLKIRMPKLFGNAEKGKIPSIDGGSYPVIVKITRGKGILGNVILARNRSEIESFINNSPAGNRYIIQEYIPGDVFDVGGYSMDGRVLFNVPQRRTITYPLRGGVAAVNDIYPDEKLIDMTGEIMEKSGWTGPFQSEFRYHPRVGEYFLIEVNAKMWGSTQLTLRSNPALLRIALESAVGKKPDGVLDFRPDLRNRWLVQELYALRFGTFSDITRFFFRFLKPCGYDFSLRDPLPDIYRYFQAVKTVLFRKSDLPRPLVDRKTHMMLNQNL